MSEFLKKIKGYKSIIFFTLALVVALAGVVAPDDLQLTDNQSEWMAVLLPLAGLLLRAVTNTPVFKNEPLPPAEFEDAELKQHQL